MAVMKHRGYHSNRAYADDYQPVNDPFRRSRTTYATQYGQQEYSVQNIVSKDLVPVLLRKHVLPGNNMVPKRWSDTFRSYHEDEGHRERNVYDDCRGEQDQIYPAHYRYKTRHASRFQKARAPVQLAVPPQQLDRDPDVVYNRHVPELREGRLETPNFYTAVTRRLVGASAPLTFDALNRHMVPVPQLMDRESPEAASYNKVSIKGWRDQVTKVVPERLAVSIPASGSRLYTDMDTTFRLDYLRMPETTFLPVDRSQTKRHYIINPEWYSERPNMNFVKPGHGPLSW